ncbi:MAG: NAD(P)/FAD-dependent oxidoreductase [Candidatus Nanoarchaeia archaeon]|nr:NAD(P)/FAD-dependent oxidoreductase [Candidatus Nanoarchaeia archaeon]
MNKEKTYDLIIIGAGPAGIFCAYEYNKLNPNSSILLFEKGREIEKRICPQRENKKCANCSPCNITSGFAGAGAFSDGKLSLSSDVGGEELSNIYGKEKIEKMIKYVDSIYLNLGADPHFYDNNGAKSYLEIKKKAIKAGVKLIDCPVRHLGTEKSFEIYLKLQNHLKEKGIEIKFNSPVTNLIIENNKIIGVETKDSKFHSKNTLIAIGREGAKWLQDTCRKNKIETENSNVDIGVRVETTNDIMNELNELYESKLVYFTETFDDKVRTFCQNPGGHVSEERYDNNLVTVNGHSYKELDRKTNNTNFALLVTKKFTDPFNEPIKYGQYIAHLSNMLSGGSVIVQKYGDFLKGRRTTDKRMQRSFVQPTLKSAVPGDLSLVLPYRIMLDIKETLDALNKIAPGIANNDTLLYGVEVKFYGNKVKVNDDLETNIKNLFVAGDGAGFTRGLIQASVNGVIVAQNITNRLKKK